MITYMPFTYISRGHMDAITQGLGPLTVYTPAAVLVPDHMLRFSNADLLDLREPAELAADQLAGALEQFRQWADTHKGNIADMAGFFKSSQGRPPLVDESDPTQITHQIRHFGETKNGRDTVPLFQAALFLAMAQEYDRHQDDVARDLGAVDTMEKKMLTQLSGHGAEPDEDFSGAGGPLAAGRAQASGLYMTDSRIKAWAQLAAADPVPSNLFLTTSHAVMAYLTDLFPDAMPMGCWDMGVDQDAGDVLRKRRAAIAAVAAASPIDANALSECMQPAREGCRSCLSVFALAGCSPRAMVMRLLSKDQNLSPRPGHGRETGNTLIGLVAAGRD